MSGACTDRQVQSDTLPQTSLSDAAILAASRHPAFPGRGLAKAM